jgi:hypothetical protein
MKLDKNVLKALIVESLQEMHNVDPREEMAMQLESSLLAMTGGDKEMAMQVLERLKDMISGAPFTEPEYDPEAEKEHEKRFMQTTDEE